MAEVVLGAFFGLFAASYFLSRRSAGRQWMVSSAIASGVLLAVAIPLASINTPVALITFGLGSASIVVAALFTTPPKVEGAPFQWHQLAPPASLISALALLIVLAAGAEDLEIPLLFGTLSALAVGSLLILMGFALDSVNREAPGLAARRVDNAVTRLWRVWWGLSSLGLAYVVAIVAVLISADSATAAFLTTVSLSPYLVIALIVAALATLAVAYTRYRGSAAVSRVVDFCCLLVVVALIIAAGITEGHWNLSISEAVSVLLAAASVGALFTHDVLGNLRLNAWQATVPLLIGSLGIGMAAAVTVVSHSGDRYWGVGGSVEWEAVFHNGVNLVFSLVMLVWSMWTIGATVDSERVRRTIPELKQSLTVDSLMFSVLAVAVTIALSINVAGRDIGETLLQVAVGVILFGVIVTNWDRHIRSEARRTSRRAWAAPYLQALRSQRRWQIGLSSAALLFGYGMSLAAYVT